MSSFIQKVATIKIFIYIIVIIVGIVLLFLGGFGIIDLIPVNDFELFGGFKVGQAAAGLILIIIGVLLLSRIRGKEETIDESGKKTILYGTNDDK